MLQFSEETLATANRIIERYPKGKSKSALLPLLHLAQAEFEGWLSAEAMDYVAKLLHIKPIEVYEVASFYSMYNLKPVGKCVLEICRTAPCWLSGADDLVDYLEQKLRIKVGQTTPDGLFTLKTVECLGSCGTAPMLQCGEKFHENLSNEKADILIDELRNENKIQVYVDNESFRKN